MTHGGYQHKPEFPFTPGTEMAGEVTALGENVTDFKIGDPVVGGALGGGLAEMGVFPPPVYAPYQIHGFCYRRGHRFGLLTAYVSLVCRGHVQPGDWVLVHGAAGGVGLAASISQSIWAHGSLPWPQRLKSATSSKPIMRPMWCLTLRAVSRSGEGNYRRRRDVIYDPVGGDVFDESVRCIAWGGRLLVVGFASGRIPTIPVNMPLIKRFFGCRCARR
ncbi:MAG: hypothetical protein CM15mP55_1390 [Hyphomicrobiales bacterium]|nr:MAG: hypothetical protein CM15mP55_1390 [Hyphomicrobiales bacterium]